MSKLKLVLSISAVSQALNPIKRTQNALAQLQGQSGRIEAYTKAKNALYASAAAVRQHNQQLAALKTTYRQTHSPSQALTN